MDTLVTGGTGFIGTSLVSRLQQGGRLVRCLAKDEMNAEALRKLGVEIVLGDLNGEIRWEPMLDGIETVYHLAGVTRARLNRDYYAGNVEATRRLARACMQHGSRLRRFVYVSSLAAVGPSPDGQPVDERTPCRPVSDYGLSKLLGEHAVLEMRDRILATIVRPAAVYGPRDREFLNYFRLVKHHLRLVVGSRPKGLSLIHSDDLVEGIVLAGESPRAEGQVYFLAGEEECTTHDLALFIAAVMEKRTLAVPLPPALVGIVGAISEAAARLRGRAALLNRQKAREFVQAAWVCSTAKACRDLGFRPRIPLAEGLRRTLDWYRGAGWL